MIPRISRWFAKSAVKYEAEQVVRLTGDCPLADPGVIDLVVRQHLEQGLDYTANIFPPTWPDGLDVEAVRFACLAEAWREARLPSEREHVTYFLDTRPERYRYGNPILGRPMLALQLERVRRARTLDRIVVATSITTADDAIAELCATLGMECFRGSLEDVLDRFYHAAVKYEAEQVVRLTGDCPLADPGVIDLVVRQHLEQGLDYTANIFPPTWPDGLDVEAVRFACLAEAWREARLPSEREHVTYFLDTRPERYRYGNVAGTEDRSGLRWTVDDPEDFALVREIYELLYPANPAFTTKEIYALLDERPELCAINAAIDRNKGFARSLEMDRKFLSRKAGSGD